MNFLIFLKVNFLFELIFLNVKISKKKYEFYLNSNYFLIFFSTKYLVERLEFRKKKKKQKTKNLTLLCNLEFEREKKKNIYIYIYIF